MRTFPSLSNHIKPALGVLLVSVLAATVMPTASTAEPAQEGSVTVQVDLGEGQVSCVMEYSTLTLPDSTLTGLTSSSIIGNPDPTLYEMLGRQNPESVRQDPTIQTPFTDEEFVAFIAFLDDINHEPQVIPVESYVGNPSDARGDQVQEIDYRIEFDDADNNPVNRYVAADRNYDGKISILDANPFFMYDAGIYEVNVDVSFQASDCQASENIGILTVLRGPVMRTVSGQEAEFAEAGFQISGVEVVENMGTAALLQVGEILAEWPSEFEYDIVSTSTADEFPTESLIARLTVHGEGATGVFSTNFNFDLYVGTPEDLSSAGFQCFLNQGLCAP